MRTCLNQLTLSSVTYFISQLTREFASAKTNAVEKYGEDLEKMKVNGPGKRKLGQGRNYGTDIFGYILTYSVLLRETFASSGGLTEGTLIFLRPQCPITRTNL